MKRYIRQAKTASAPVRKTVQEKAKTETVETEKPISVDWKELAFGVKLANVQAKLSRLYRQGDVENTINGLGQEDVLSEVVLNLLETGNEFAEKSETNMKRYLLGSVKNQWIDLNKAKSANSISLDSLKDKKDKINGDTANLENILFNLPENDELLEHVTKKLRKTSKIDKALFIWYYHKGYTLKEISDRTGKPIKTVHRMIERIYVRLGKMKLREYWDDGKQLIPCVGGISSRHTVDVSGEIEASPISWLKRARRESDPAVKASLIERFREESDRTMKQHHELTLNAVPKDINPAEWSPTVRLPEVISCRIPNRDDGRQCWIGDKIPLPDQLKAKWGYQKI